MLTINRTDNLLRLIHDGEAKVDQMLEKERDDVQQVLAYVKHSLKMAESYLASAHALKKRDEVKPDFKTERKCATCGGRLP